MIVRNTGEARHWARMDATDMDSQWGSSRRAPVENTDNSSASSTPFASAPSSPRNSATVPSRFYGSRAFPGRGRETFDCFQSTARGSATLSSWEDGAEIQNKVEPAPSIAGTNDSEEFVAFSAASSDFDFSARFSEADGPVWSPAPMSSADELFYNGQIRPLRLYSSIQLEESDVAKPPASQSDDGFFDFRSSANYVLPVPRSPVTPPKQEQKKQGCALPKPASQVSPCALDQWKKMGKEAGRRASLDEPMRRNDQTKSQSPAASERPRRAREGSQRRSRSLSPLRVFHIDDQPRPSFESEAFYSPAGLPDHAKGDCKAAVQERTKLKKSWTLKELLHGGDRRVHGSTSAKGDKWGNKGGEKSAAKGDGKRTGSTAAPASPSSSSRSKSKSTGPKQALSPHERHYTSQRAQAEQMRKKTFLPYNQGLLGCLGFSSKSYRSFAGLNPPSPS